LVPTRSVGTSSWALGVVGEEEAGGDLGGSLGALGKLCGSVRPGVGPGGNVGDPEEGGELAAPVVGDPGQGRQFHIDGEDAAGAQAF
jgi:hypothetical protein